MGQDGDESRATQGALDVLKAVFGLPYVGVGHDQGRGYLVWKMPTKVFEEKGEAQKRRTDTGLCPIEKHGSVRKRNEVVGVEIGVDERVRPSFGLQIAERPPHSAFEVDEFRSAQRGGLRKRWTHHELRESREKRADRTLQDG